LPRVRWSIGPFGVKDLFTLINLMGGAFGIYFVMEQRLELAGAAVLAGYLFGDTLDGVVARLTHTSNRFGSELDTATDHFVQAIVPALIVFAVYARGGHRVLGFVLLSVVIACATVRQALFTVAKMGDPLMYCGLPRTVSGYASMAFVLSRFFFRGDAASYAIGAVLVSALAIMGLLPIPYMTHRGARRMQTYVKAFVFVFLVTPVVAFFVARDFTFDVLFVWTFGYALLAWVPLHRDERRAFFVRYRQWASEVSKV
jgi:CDP-diacylglycerol---serine O-phosphatidyltransferase